jgi:hypothetical protein
MPVQPNGKQPPTKSAPKSQPAKASENRDGARKPEKHIVWKTPHRENRKTPEIDVDMLRDSLGYLVAAATDARDPYDTVRSVDKIISYERAMLKYLKIYDGPYPDLFDQMRKSLNNARNICNIQTGDWKDTSQICSILFDDLLYIAVSEGLITINSGMFNASIFRSDEGRNLGSLPTAADMND